MNNCEFLILNSSLSTVFTDKLIPPERYVVLDDGSALMCYPDEQQEVNDSQNFVLGILTLVGNTLSISSLVLTFVIYLCCKEFHSIPGKMLMNYMVALLCAQVLLQCNDDFVKWNTICRTVAALQHYFWLATFTWINAITYRMQRTFSRQLSDQSSLSNVKELVLFCLFSWGCPLVIVGPCVALDVFDSGVFKYGGQSTCWIDNIQPFRILYFFALPILLFTLTNVSMMVKCVTSLREAFHVSSLANPVRKKQILKVYFKPGYLVSCQISQESVNCGILL
jgi:hypothetical protein